MKNKVYRRLGIGALALGILGVGTSASAGTWDDADGEAFHPFKKGQNPEAIRYSRSSGGDFKVKFTGVDGNGFSFDLMESDGANNPADVVKKNIRVSKDGEFIFRDIGKYVDGSNKRAEFYVKIHDVLSDQKGVVVWYYD